MRILTALLACLLLILPCAAAGETVVTSFYPIYLIALNLCDGVEGIDVHNLAAPDFGCLHDYQLTVRDMKALSSADAFMINGADMEEFIEPALESLPELEQRIVDASPGVFLIEEDEEGETPYNPHIWLSVRNMQTMTANLAEGLAAMLPAHAEAIRANRDAYLERLRLLDAEITEQAIPLKGFAIVTFHEAFPYFADAYGIEIAAVMAHEPGDSLSAGELMELVKLERSLGNPPLFTEPQYSDSTAITVSQETGAPVYQLDPCVTGPANPPLDYYETVMRRNLTVLLEAFESAGQA